MNRVDFGADAVHGPDGLATDIPAFCASYEAAIAAAGGVDLQILGIGTDGHIGFNEPGSSLASRTRIKTLTRQTLPAAVPGIATGTILALSRAMGEAAPLLLLGGLVFVKFDPNGLLSGFTTMPIQIFDWAGRSQVAFQELAAAASILLLVLVIAMNGLAIIIRNKFTTGQ